MTTIPLRLQQRRRELEDLLQVHDKSAYGIRERLAGMAEAEQFYAEDAAERAASAAAQEPEPAPPTERARAPRRDIRGMVYRFLGTGVDARQYTVDEIASNLGLLPREARNALESLRSRECVESVTGAPDGPWRTMRPYSQPEQPPALLADGTADEGREPALGLAQDAA